jgi:ribosomal protein S30
MQITPLSGKSSCLYRTEPLGVSGMRGTTFGAKGAFALDFLSVPSRDGIYKPHKLWIVEVEAIAIAAALRVQRPAMLAREQVYAPKLHNRTRYTGRAAQASESRNSPVRDFTDASVSVGESV